MACVLRHGRGVLAAFAEGRHLGSTKRVACHEARRGRDLGGLRVLASEGNTPRAVTKEATGVPEATIAEARAGKTTPHAEL